MRVSNWVFGHAIWMSLATGATLITGEIITAIVAMLISMLVFIGMSRHDWGRFHPVGGYANHVTAFRFIVLIFALAIHAHINPYVFVALIVMVMLADGLDGYLARKLGLTSVFGEVFDTEVDAFLALSLCLLIWFQFPQAVWVLCAGLLRYLFGILYRILGWYKWQRPDMPETKVFAVIFFISLLTPWVFPWTYAWWSTVAGAVLVGYSFLREFILMASLRNK